MAQRPISKLNRQELITAVRGFQPLSDGDAADLTRADLIKLLKTASSQRQAEAAAEGVPKARKFNPQAYRSWLLAIDKLAVETTNRSLKSLPFDEGQLKAWYRQGFSKEAVLELLNPEDVNLLSLAEQLPDIASEEIAAEPVLYLEVPQTPLEILERQNPPAPETPYERILQILGPSASRNPSPSPAGFIANAK